MPGKGSTYRKGSQQLESHYSWLFTLFWKHWACWYNHTHRKTSYSWLKAIRNDAAIIHHVKVSRVTDSVWLIWLRAMRPRPPWFHPGKWGDQQGSPRIPGAGIAGPRTEDCLTAAVSLLGQSTLPCLWNSSLWFDESLCAFINLTPIRFCLASAPSPHSLHEVLSTLILHMWHMHIHSSAGNSLYFHQSPGGGNNPTKE